MKLLLALTLLCGCSQIDQERAVASLLRPDTLPEARGPWPVVERPLNYGFTGTDTMTPGQHAYLDYLRVHGGPQTYSGEFMERAMGASPFFTHGR